MTPFFRQKNFRIKTAEHIVCLKIIFIYFFVRTTKANIAIKNNSLLKQFSGQSQPFFIFNATSRRFSSEYFASSSLFRLNFFSLFFTFRFFCIFTTVFVFFTLLFFFTFFVGDAFFLMVSSSEVTLSVVEASPG